MREEFTLPEGLCLYIGRDLQPFIADAQDVTHVVFIPGQGDSLDWLCDMIYLTGKALGVEQIVFEYKEEEEIQPFTRAWVYEFLLLTYGELWNG